MKFATGVDIDNILDEFAGQGHRTRVKVMRLKKHHFHDFLIWVNKYQVLAHGVMSWCHMTSWDHIVMSYDVTAWRHITREVQQHLSVVFTLASASGTPSADFITAHIRHIHSTIFAWEKWMKRFCDSHRIRHFHVAMMKGYYIHQLGYFSWSLRDG